MLLNEKYTERNKHKKKHFVTAATHKLHFFFAEFDLDFFLTFFQTCKINTIKQKQYNTKQF